MYQDGGVDGVEELMGADERVGRLPLHCGMQGGDPGEHRLCSRFSLRVDCDFHRQRVQRLRVVDRLARVDRNCGPELVVIAHPLADLLIQRRRGEGPHQQVRQRRQLLLLALERTQQLPRHLPRLLRLLPAQRVVLAAHPLRPKGKQRPLLHPHQRTHPLHHALDVLPPHHLPVPHYTTHHTLNQRKHAEKHAERGQKEG